MPQVCFALHTYVLHRARDDGPTNGFVGFFLCITPECYIYICVYTECINLDIPDRCMMYIKLCKVLWTHEGGFNRHLRHTRTHTATQSINLPYLLGFTQPSSSLAPGTCVTCFRPASSTSPSRTHSGKLEAEATGSICSDVPLSWPRFLFCFF